MAKKLEHLVDEETFLVLSSDLSHFYNKQQAEILDEQCIEQILSGNPSEVLKSEACGKTGISAFLETRLSRGLQPEFIHYSNSATFNKDENNVVGYCGIGFSGAINLSKDDENVLSLSMSTDFSRTITGDCKKELFKAIRDVLKTYIAEHRILDCSALVCKYPFLNQDAATFVTLNKGNKLRGCIGSLQSSKPLAQDIIINAIKAASEDIRFEPVTLEELDQIQIEISILNSATFLKCKNEFDLLNQIEPHKHGLIIQRGNRRATFLPQVWEKISSKTDFLTQLCKKADLNPNAWRLAKEKVQIFAYTVTKIKE